MTLYVLKRTADLFRVNRNKMISFPRLSSLPSFRKGYAYVLNECLYLSLTNDVNADTTILSSRGPGFNMSKASGFSPLPENTEPCASELAEIVYDIYNSSLDTGAMGELDGGVCFAGLGEPLLRANTLLEVVAKVKEKRNGINFRINTNGLFGSEVVDTLISSGLLHNREQDTRRETGIGRVSVFLPCADPNKYNNIMKPKSGRGFADVCNFIIALSEAGYAVECTCTNAPGINVSEVEDLAISLGAIQFRERSYHPE